MQADAAGCFWDGSGAGGSVGRFWDGCGMADAVGCCWNGEGERADVSGQFLDGGAQSVDVLVDVGVGGHGVVGMAYDALDVLWTCTCGRHAGAEGVAGGVGR